MQHAEPFRRADRYARRDSYLGWIGLSMGIFFVLVTLAEGTARAVHLALLMTGDELAWWTVWEADWSAIGVLIGLGRCTCAVRPDADARPVAPATAGSPRSPPAGS
jgi:hypothetical protein